MKFLKSCGALFVFGNFLIAMATLCLAWETQLLTVNMVIFRPYQVVIFMATFFVYNLHRFIGTLSDPDNLSGRNQWAMKHLNRLRFFVIISAILLLLSALFLIKQVGWLLIPLCAITLAYSIPVIRRQKKYIRLRDVPWMKTFLIALMWTLVTVFLPAFREHVDPFKLHILLAALERALFIFAITIPFDIRDMEEDRKKNVISLVVHLGEERSKKLAYLLVAVFTLVACFNYHNDIRTLSALLLSMLPVTGLIAGVRKERSDYYYLLWLDGTMILQPLLLLCFKNL